MLGDVLTLSTYHLPDSSQQHLMKALLNSHFMEREQRHHKMLFAWKVGIGTRSGSEAGAAGYPWPHHLCLDPLAFICKSFHLSHSTCNGLLPQRELLPEQRLREVKFLPEGRQQS